ncbi:pyrroloquinoline quinone biosynthesis peptide chaperone PqqD [Pseudonocardiaceae bacterium YIM PH 21723]|nr:pyrroloquinoline quinone biosynthesis peptide chaperone PqqD [Pseudonocardiaceae bacterium YIM PH 21723]
MRPRLLPGVRISYDDVRDRTVVLYPEGVLMPNSTACAVLVRCDGRTSVAQIVDDLRAIYADVDSADVLGLLRRLAADQLLTLEPSDG